VVLLELVEQLPVHLKEVVVLDDEDLVVPVRNEVDTTRQREREPNFIYKTKGEVDDSNEWEPMERDYNSPT